MFNIALHELYQYKESSIIVNIDERTFLGHLRMGDIVAVLNVIQDIRNKSNNNNIKFHFLEHGVQQRDYVYKFVNYLIENTDFLSISSGDFYLTRYGNIWEHRKREGETLKIYNPYPTIKKICVFPLIDAEYDTQRNWPISVFQSIIDKYSKDIYRDFEKIICHSSTVSLPSSLNLKEFKISTDFLENLHHILECEYYIGGATGLSLFASVLEGNNKYKEYYYHDGLHGSWPSKFTAPFYTDEGNKYVNYYNLD